MTIYNHKQKKLCLSTHYRLNSDNPHHHQLPHEGAKYYGNVLFPTILSVTLKFTVQLETAS